VCRILPEKYVAVDVLTCFLAAVVTATVDAIKQITRKQIARQLRIQYVDRINSNPMTVKSGLRVTQGHWKRNHWIDHTQLTVSRVI